MVLDCHRSERRAYPLVGISRDGYRNPAPPSAFNPRLSPEIVDLAHRRRRAGCRMIHDLLRPQYAAEGIAINAKRIYRLHSEAALIVRRRKKLKRSGERVPLVQANDINQTWSLDFVSDSLADGRCIKCLTVVEDIGTRRISGFIVLVMRLLLLQACPEVLHRRIVIANSASTHRRFHAKLLSQSAILAACVLAATVAVMNQPRPWTFLPHCHPRRLWRKQGRHVVLHRPADDL